MNHGAWLVLTFATATAGPCTDLVAPNPDFGAAESESGADESDAGESDGGLGQDTPAEPSEQSFEGLGDTYVDKDTPLEAHGSESVVLVDARRTTFLRLPDLASVDGSLSSLTLTLTCTQGAGEIEISAVVNQWDEATLTSTDTGSLGSMSLGTFEPVVGDNVIELADLLLPFQLAQASPSIRLDPAATSNNDNDLLECSSREGGAGPRFSMSTGG